MKITAAVTRGAGAEFEIADLSLEEPRDDEVLVRISAVGLCHTDLVARDQILPVPLPAVFGHEGAGVVVKTGAAVTKVKPGDPVLLTFSYCGECTRCQAGEPAYCELSVGLNFGGCRLDGSKSLHEHGKPVSSHFFCQSSFATHALATENNVVKVDPDLPLETLAPLGCGVQTGAGAVLNALVCPPRSSLVIFGGGSVGLSAVLGAVVAGCSTIIVSDPVGQRRDLALELGATHVIDPLNENAGEKVRAITGKGVDFALETTGIAAVMNEAISCLRPHGTLGLLGVPVDPRQPTPGYATAVLMYGYTIKGIIEGESNPDDFLPKLIDLYRQGKFPFDRLISFYPFERINQAVQDQHDGKIVKAILTFAN